MRLSLTFTPILLSSIVLSSIALVSCSSKPEPEAAEVLSKATTQPAAAAAKMPDAAEYLAKAAAEPGAVKTASGLVYRDLKPGTGASPKATDTVTVNYRGTLLDGTVFDMNSNFPFPLNRVIPCWTEGVQMMKVGGKAQLVCPPAIAYGEAGSPPVIPPSATLVFEIDLLKVEH